MQINFKGFTTTNELYKLLEAIRETPITQHPPLATNGSMGLFYSSLTNRLHVVEGVKVVLSVHCDDVIEDTLNKSTKHAISRDGGCFAFIFNNTVIENFYSHESVREKVGDIHRKLNKPKCRVFNTVNSNVENYTFTMKSSNYSCIEILNGGEYILASSSEINQPNELEVYKKVNKTYKLVRSVPHSSLPSFNRQATIKSFAVVGNAIVFILENAVNVVEALSIPVNSVMCASATMHYDWVVHRDLKESNKVSHTRIGDLLLEITLDQFEKVKDVHLLTPTLVSYHSFRGVYLNNQHNKQLTLDIPPLDVNTVTKPILLNIKGE